ncbi:MAG: hypothetical protein R3C68_15170 [Myxococcota bacterium]
MSSHNNTWKGTLGAMSGALGLVLLFSLPVTWLVDGTPLLLWVKAGLGSALLAIYA